MRRLPIVRRANRTPSRVITLGQMPKPGAAGIIDIIRADTGALRLLHAAADNGYNSRTSTRLNRAMGERDTPIYPHMETTAMHTCSFHQ